MFYRHWDQEDVLSSLGPRNRSPATGASCSHLENKKSKIYPHLYLSNPSRRVHDEHRKERGARFRRGLGEVDGPDAGGRDRVVVVVVVGLIIRDLVPRDRLLLEDELFCLRVQTWKISAWTGNTRGNVSSGGCLAFAKMTLSACCLDSRDPNIGHRFEAAVGLLVHLEHLEKVVVLDLREGILLRLCVKKRDVFPRISGSAALLTCVFTSCTESKQ